ncbi:hypothetical protein CW304_02485 [Bacillus sp. UFRGS-B20]|nr:hypothetical protein CW304_02485 [Bacillus sp. UFRGS-B20]
MVDYQRLQHGDHITVTGSKEHIDTLKNILGVKKMPLTKLRGIFLTYMSKMFTYTYYEDGSHMSIVT